MMKAIEAANLFVELANSSECDSIDNLKLNKLLYFAQGWSLALRGKPIFEEDIEAWQYGPVVRSVYTSFSGCGRDRISSVYGEFDSILLNQEDVDFIIDISNAYDDYSGVGLMNLTHQAGTPWTKAYVEGAKRKIPNEEIRKYFLNEEPIERFTINADKFERVGYHNAEGVLILPREMNDSDQ